MRTLSVTENRILMAQARDSLKGKWGLAIGAFVVYVLFFVAIEWIPVIGWLISFLVSGSMSIGFAIFSLSLSRKQEAKWDQIFYGFQKFGIGLGAFVLQFLFIILWSILLIIPGIIAAYSYAMTYYIIAENDSIGPLEAISKSKEMMYGNKWKSFCLTFRFLGWILLCILTFGIGVLFVGPYMAVSFVQFYDDLKPKASIADKGRSVDGNDDAIAVNPTIVDDQEEGNTVIGTSSIYLEFLNGSLSGQRIMVFKDTTIGRSSENDIALSEKTISASHCRIKVVNDEFVIEDLNSTNGTFIDGQKISKQNIAQGNELQLSSIKIKVH